MGKLEMFNAFKSAKELQSSRTHGQSLFDSLDSESQIIVNNMIEAIGDSIESVNYRDVRITDNVVLMSINLDEDNGIVISDASSDNVNTISDCVTTTFAAKGYIVKIVGAWPNNVDFSPRAVVSWLFESNDDYVKLSNTIAKVSKK